MDKYVEVLCNQNPYIELECERCKAVTKVKSKELFKRKTYDLVCPKCKKSTTYDTTKFVIDFVKQMKDLGFMVE